MSDYDRLMEVMVANLEPGVFPRNRELAFLRVREAFWEIAGTVVVICPNVTRRELISAMAVAGLLPRRNDDDTSVSLVCPFRCGFSVESGREFKFVFMIFLITEKNY